MREYLETGRMTSGFPAGGGAVAFPAMAVHGGGGTNFGFGELGLHFGGGGIGFPFGGHLP
eukprot:3313066-Alexandrium_andersonii.AAC.1